MFYEFEPHRHQAPMTKAELAQHLTQPHKQASGSWISSCGPVSALLRWSRAELDATHQEYHDGR